MCNHIGLQSLQTLNDFVKKSPAPQSSDPDFSNKIRSYPWDGHCTSGTDLGDAGPQKQKRRKRETRCSFSLCVTLVSSYQHEAKAHKFHLVSPDGDLCMSGDNTVDVWRENQSPLRVWYFHTFGRRGEKSIKRNVVVKFCIGDDCFGDVFHTRHHLKIALLTVLPTRRFKRRKTTDCLTYQEIQDFENRRVHNFSVGGLRD